MNQKSDKGKRMNRFLSIASPNEYTSRLLFSLMPDYKPGVTYGIDAFHIHTNLSYMSDENIVRLFRDFQNSSLVGLENGDIYAVLLIIVMVLYDVAIFKKTLLDEIKYHLNISHVLRMYERELSQRPDTSEGENRNDINAIGVELHDAVHIAMTNIIEESSFYEVYSLCDMYAFQMHAATGGDTDEEEMYEEVLGLIEYLVPVVGMIFARTKYFFSPFISEEVYFDELVSVAEAYIAQLTYDTQYSYDAEFGEVLSKFVRIPGVYEAFCEKKLSQEVQPPYFTYDTSTKAMEPLKPTFGDLVRKYLIDNAFTYY